MNPSDKSKAVAFSEKVFRRLLAAYPEKHREEYGAAMAQLFCDQCRDAWSESRGWGLTNLWLRVLPDVVGTSFLEHLESIKERKFMLNRIGGLFRSAQTYKFFTVFTAVFLLVVITTTVVTFILPESFVGLARINVQKDSSKTQPMTGNGMQGYGVDPYFIQTEFEVMQSQALLSKVVDNPQLNLKERWAVKYRGGERLTTLQAIDLFKHFISINPVRNTSIIEIRVYRDEPEEAALLANALAKAYREYHLARRAGAEIGIVEILDMAAPNPTPVRPNKPLNIIIGIILGTVLGLIAGGAVAGISFWRRQNAPPKLSRG